MTTTTTNVGFFDSAVGKLIRGAGLIALAAGLEYIFKSGVQAGIVVQGSAAYVILELLVNVLDPKTPTLVNPLSK